VRKCPFGLANIKVTETKMGLSIMAYQPSGKASSAAYLTFCRQGLQRLEDSKRMPLPTWRLLPCGAGLPRTVNVKLLGQVVEGVVNCRVQQSQGKRSRCDFALLYFDCLACNFDFNGVTGSGLRKLCKLFCAVGVKINSD